MKNSLFAVGGLTAVALLWVTTVAAHHGWDWTEDEQTEMTGTITAVLAGRARCLASVHPRH